MKILHYFFDPVCGWCYGAAPLLEAASRVDGLALRLHAGGLWLGPISPPPETRDYIRAADGRIAAMTGQPFGTAYLEGWLADPSTVLDSRPPIGAWLAVQKVAPELGLDALREIQRAHYVEGRHIARREVLADIASSMGVDPDRFAGALAESDVDAHIAQTRREMARLGVKGFPAAFLERDGRVESLPVQSFYGKPEAFAQALAG